MMIKQYSIASLLRGKEKNEESWIQSGTTGSGVSWVGAEEIPCLNRTPAARPWSSSISRTTTSRAAATRSPEARRRRRPAGCGAHRDFFSGAWAWRVLKNSLAVHLAFVHCPCGRTAKSHSQRHCAHHLFHHLSPQKIPIPKPKTPTPQPP